MAESALPVAVQLQGPALRIEPASVLFRGYEPGTTERRELRLVNSGKTPIEVSVHEDDTLASSLSGPARLTVSLFRICGMPRPPAVLALAPNGGSAVLQVEFTAPRASSKAPRAHSHTIVFEVVGGADVSIPVRATPAPPQLFESPPPRTLDFGRVPLGSAPRRVYRFRCTQGGTHRYRIFVSPSASEATHDFAFAPEEGTLTRGDALQLTVSFGASRHGIARCKLDIVVTSTMPEEDGKQQIVRRFAFDVAGFAVDPTALSPSVQEQQQQSEQSTAPQPQQPPSITGTTKQHGKAKKRIPKDQRVLALETAFRRDMAAFEEQLSQRAVRTARTPGDELETPLHITERIAAERAGWERTTQPPVESHTAMGRPLLRRPTDPLPRPPAGLVETEMAGAPVQSRRDQSLWRFRVAARIILLRVRAQHRIANINEFLSSVGFDKVRVAATVDSLLPPQRKLASASVSQATVATVPPTPTTTNFAFAGLPHIDEASMTTALGRPTDEPTTSLLNLTCLFDPYDRVELLPVADARTERHIREAMNWVVGTRNPTYWYPPTFDDVQLRSGAERDDVQRGPLPQPSSTTVTVQMPQPQQDTSTSSAQLALPQRQKLVKSAGPPATALPPVAAAEKKDN